MSKTTQLVGFMEDVDAPPEFVISMQKQAFGIDGMTNIDLTTLLAVGDFNDIVAQLGIQKAPNEAVAMLNKIKAELTA